MTETFVTEAVLQEILVVLRKHHIPVETVALDVSLLDENFDVCIPQLQTYKAGHFHKSYVIDDIPMLFNAQRRYPFDEIVQPLEQRILPSMQEFAETLRQEFSELDISFTSAQGPKYNERSYCIRIECTFSDDAHASYNVLTFSIYLQQREATAYPTLEGLVAWLVDEESGGDWGFDVVNRVLSDRQTFTPRSIDQLERALPALYKSFRGEIHKKRAGLV